MSGTTFALEWGGAALALAGATGLAWRERESGWAILAMLGSNLCWIAYALLTKTYGLFVMQLGLGLISAAALARWTLLPAPMRRSRLTQRK